MKMSNTPKQWEIWSAEFAFDDNPNISKTRPVLVLENKELYPVLAAKITKHASREYYPGEYEIKDWKSAGLKVPSTIRLSKRLLLQEVDFKSLIGKLKPIDIIGVQEKLKEVL